MFTSVAVLGLIWVLYWNERVMTLTNPVVSVPKLVRFPRLLDIK
jgi:hypothetical protein